MSNAAQATQRMDGLMDDGALAFDVVSGELLAAEHRIHRAAYGRPFSGGLRFSQQLVQVTRGRWP